MRLIKSLDGKYIAAYRNINLGEFNTLSEAREFILSMEFNEATQDWIDGMIEARDFIERK